MDQAFSLTTPTELVAAMAITVLASFVKGAIGFALPMIMISGLATFLSAELALALLIIPTLLANVIQAFGDGLRAALASARVYRRYLVIVLAFIALSAQLVAILPSAVLFFTLGLPITGFAIWQLLGKRLEVGPSWRGPVEIVVASIARFTGGLSGVWGPPTVAYLTMIGAAKDDSVRVQGVIYLSGACVLTVAHINSGVLNAHTAPLSLFMVLPASVGLWIGMRTRGKMDEKRFRRWTLIVLVVAGLNLIRRGVVGF